MQGNDAADNPRDELNRPATPVTPNALAEQDVAAVQEPLAGLERRGILLQRPAPHTLTLFLPARRNPAVVWMLTAITLVWTAAFVATVFALQWPLVAGFGFFEAILVRFALKHWFRSTRLEIADGRLSVEHHWLGTVQRRSVACLDLSTLEAVPGEYVLNTTYFDLRLAGGTVPEFRIDTGIPHEALAVWLAGELRRECAAAAPAP